MNVVVLDMQPISPAVGGGRLRLLGLYHALGPELSATYIGTYDWPGESGRDQQLTPGLREITVPLSPEHFAADAELRAETGGKNVIDTAFHRLAHLSPAYLERTRQAAREADIIICSHPWVYPLVKDVVDRRRGLLVYDSHNCEGLLRIDLLDDGGRGTSIAKEVISIERAFCRDADLILACSQEDLLLYRDLYGIPCEKVRIVPNGVFTDALKPPTPEQRAEYRARLEFTHRQAAIFIGSGYHFNIEAARFIIEQLAPSHSEVLFVIAGGVGQSLAEAGCTDPMRDNVRITGFLSDEDRRAYLSACDFGLNPMFGGSGTNIKMFDYMAAGLPTIATEIGARGVATLQERAFLVAQPNDFSRRLELLVEHPSTRRQLSRSSRQLATELYSWERISATLGELLKAAYARKGHSDPKFSVIVVTFDHGQLAVSVKALQQQTEGEFEIIVVDGSGLRWPGAEQASESKFIYVQSNLQNPAALRNLGASLAGGEVIAYLPGGFTPPPAWLAQAQPYFAHADVAALKGGGDPDGSRDGYLEFDGFIRRSAFMQAGQFDTGIQGALAAKDLEMRLRKTGAIFTDSQAPPVGGSSQTPLANVADWADLDHGEFAIRACQMLQGLPPDDPFIRDIISSLTSGKIQRSEALASLAELTAAAPESGITLIPILPELFREETSVVHHLADLLNREGDDFVQTAYLAILHRSPDPTGFEYYRSELRSGNLTKTTALKRLLESEEAQRMQTKILGLNVDIPSQLPAGSIFYRYL
jgi:glycosyltransferase involved in cell wall biosynthesis